MLFDQNPQNPQAPATQPTPQPQDTLTVVNEAARALYRKRMAENKAIDLSEDEFVESLRPLVRTESGGSHDQVSPRGAVGVFQVMPGTAKGEYNLDTYDINQNIAAGLQYHYDNLARARPFTGGNKGLARYYAAGMYNGGYGDILKNLQSGKKGREAIPSSYHDGNMYTRDYARQVAEFDPDEPAAPRKLTVVFTDKKGENRTVEFDESERPQIEDFLKKQGATYRIDDPDIPPSPVPLSGSEGQPARPAQSYVPVVTTPLPEGKKEYPDRYSAVNPFSGEVEKYKDREITLTDKDGKPVGKKKFSELVQQYNQDVQRFNSAYGGISPLEYQLSKTVAGSQAEYLAARAKALEDLQTNLTAGDATQRIIESQRDQMTVQVVPGAYAKQARPLGAADRANPVVKANVSSLMERHGDNSRLLTLRAQAQATLKGDALAKRLAEIEDEQIAAEQTYADVAEISGRMAQLKATEGRRNERESENLTMPTDYDARIIAAQVGQVKVATGVSARLKQFATELRNKGVKEIPDDAALAKKTPQEMFELYRKYAAQLDNVKIEQLVAEEAAKLPIGVREAAFDPRLPNAGSDFASLIGADPAVTSYIGREFDRLKRSKEFETEFAERVRREGFAKLRDQVNTPEMQELRKEAHKTPEGFEKYYTKTNISLPIRPSERIKIGGGDTTFRDFAISTQRADLSEEQRNAMYGMLGKAVMDGSLRHAPGMTPERMARLYGFKFQSGQKGYGFADPVAAGKYFAQQLVAARDYDLIDVPQSGFAVRFYDYENLKSGGAPVSVLTAGMDQIFGFDEMQLASENNPGGMGRTSVADREMNALFALPQGLTGGDSGLSKDLNRLLPEPLVRPDLQTPHMDALRKTYGGPPPPEVAISVGRTKDAPRPSGIMTGDDRRLFETQIAETERAANPILDEKKQVKPDAVAREYYKAMGYTDSQIDAYQKQHGTMPGIRKLNGDFYSQAELQRMFDPQTGMVRIPSAYRKMPVFEGDAARPHVTGAMQAKIDTASVKPEDLMVEGGQGIVPFMKDALRQNLAINGIALTPAVAQMIEELPAESLLYDARTKQMRSAPDIADELNRTGTVYTSIPYVQLGMAMARSAQAQRLAREREKVVGLQIGFGDWLPDWMQGGVYAKDVKSPEMLAVQQEIRRSLTFNGFIEREITAPIMDFFSSEGGYREAIGRDLETDQLSPEAVLPAGMDPQSQQGREAYARYKATRWTAGQVLELGKSMTLALGMTRPIVSGLIEGGAAQGASRFAQFVGRPTVANMIGQTVTATFQTMPTADGYVWNPITRETTRAKYDRRTGQLRPETWGDVSKQFAIQVGTTPFLAYFQGFNPNLTRTLWSEFGYGGTQELLEGGSWRQIIEAGIANAGQEVIGDTGFKYGNRLAYGTRRFLNMMPGVVDGVKYRTTVNGQTFEAINELPGEQGQIRTRLLNPKEMERSENQNAKSEAKGKGQKYRVVELSPMAFEQMLMRRATPGGTIEGFTFIEAPNGVQIPTAIAEAAKLQRQFFNEGNDGAEQEYVTRRVMEADTEAQAAGKQLEPFERQEIEQKARERYAEDQLRAVTPGQVLSVSGVNYLVERDSSDGIVAVPLDANDKPIMTPGEGLTGQPLTIYEGRSTATPKTGGADVLSGVVGSVTVGVDIPSLGLQDPMEADILFNPAPELIEGARNTRILPMDVSNFIRNRALGLDEQTSFNPPATPAVEAVRRDLSTSQLILRATIANQSDEAKTAYREGVARARERTRNAQNTLISDAIARATALRAEGKTEEAIAVVREAQAQAAQIQGYLMQFEQGTLPTAEVATSAEAVAVEQPSSAPAQAAPDFVESSSLPRLDVNPEIDGVSGPFVEGMTYIKEGSEHSAYRSADGTKVYKFNHGNGELSREGFNERVQQQLAINRLLGDGSMRVIGSYVGFDGRSVFPIYEMNYLEGEVATPQQAEEALRARGFEKSAEGEYKATVDGVQYRFKDPTDNFMVTPDGQTLAFDGDLTWQDAPSTPGQTFQINAVNQSSSPTTVPNIVPPAESIARVTPRVGGTTPITTPAETQAEPQVALPQTQVTPPAASVAPPSALTPVLTPIARRFENYAKHFVRLAGIVAERFTNNLYSRRQYLFENANGSITTLSGVDASLVAEPNFVETEGRVAGLQESDAFLNEFTNDVIDPSKVREKLKVGTLLVVAYNPNASTILRQNSEPNFKKKKRAVFMVTSVSREAGTFTVARMYANDSYKFTMSAKQGEHVNLSMQKDLGETVPTRRSTDSTGAIKVLGIGTPSDTLRNGQVFTNRATGENFRVIGSTESETVRIIPVDGFGAPLEDGWYNSPGRIVTQQELKSDEWVPRPEISVSGKGTEVEAFFAQESQRPDGSVKWDEWDIAGFDSTALISVAGTPEGDQRMQRYQAIQQLRDQQRLHGTQNLKSGDLVTVPNKAAVYQIVDPGRFVDGVTLQAVDPATRTPLVSDKGATSVLTWPNERRQELRPFLAAHARQANNEPIVTPSPVRSMETVFSEPVTPEKEVARTQIQEVANAVEDALEQNGQYVRRVGAQGQIFFWTDEGASIVSGLVAGLEKNDFFLGFNTSMAIFRDAVGALRIALRNPSSEQARSYFSNLAEFAEDALRSFRMNYRTYMDGLIARHDDLKENEPDAYKAARAVVDEVRQVFEETNSAIDAEERFQNLTRGNDNLYADASVLMQREILLRQESHLMNRADLFEGASRGETKALNRLQAVSDEIGQLPANVDLETQHAPLPSYFSEAGFLMPERIDAMRAVGTISSAAQILFHERQHGTLFDVSRALYPDHGRDAKRMLFISPSFSGFLNEAVAPIAAAIPENSPYAGIRNDLVAVAQEIMANGTMGLSSEASQLYPKGTPDSKIAEDANEIIHATYAAVMEYAEAHPEADTDALLRAITYVSVLQGGTYGETQGFETTNLERTGNERQAQAETGNREAAGDVRSDQAGSEQGRNASDVEVLAPIPATRPIVATPAIATDIANAAQETMETEAIAPDPVEVAQAVSSVDFNRDYSGLADTEEAYDQAKPEIERLFNLVAGNVQLFPIPGFRYISVFDLMTDLVDGIFRYSPIRAEGHPLSQTFTPEIGQSPTPISYLDALHAVREIIGRAQNPSQGDYTSEGDFFSALNVTAFVEDPTARGIVVYETLGPEMRRASNGTTEIEGSRNAASPQIASALGTQGGRQKQKAKQGAKAPVVRPPSNKTQYVVVSVVASDGRTRTFANPGVAPNLDPRLQNGTRIASGRADLALYDIELDPNLHADLTPQGRQQVLQEAGYDGTIDNSLTRQVTLFAEPALTPHASYGEYLAANALIEDLPEAPVGEGRGDMMYRQAIAGQRVLGQYRFGPLSSLIPSNNIHGDPNPAYNQNIQPRDREAKKSQAHIMEMAREFTPGLIATPSELVQIGPPTVGPDMMVEAGSGRVILLQHLLLTNPEKFQQYLEQARREAIALGIPEAATNIPDGVLYFERMTPMTEQERFDFAVKANQDMQGSMGTDEQAQADARLIAPNDLMELSVRDGDLQGALQSMVVSPKETLVSRFINRLPPAARGAMVTKRGDLSVAGLARIQAAIIARIFRGPSANAVIAALTAEQAQEGDIRTYKALLQFIPELARLRGRIDSGLVEPEYDITEQIASAYLQAIELNTSPKLQPGMFTNYEPNELELIERFILSRRSTAPFVRAVKAYVDSVATLSSAQQGQIQEGILERPSAQELFDRAFGEAPQAEAQGSLFDQSEAASAQATTPQPTPVATPAQSQPAPAQPRQPQVTPAPLAEPAQQQLTTFGDTFYERGGDTDIDRLEAAKREGRIQNYRSGDNNGGVAFVSTLHRDLYNNDITASQGSESALKRRKQELTRIAQALNISQNEVISLAAQVKRDVRDQMKKLKDGEVRFVQDNVGIPSPPQQAAPQQGQTDVLSGPGIIIREVLNTARDRMQQAREIGEATVGTPFRATREAILAAAARIGGQPQSDVFPYRALQKKFFDIYSEARRLTPQNAQKINDRLTEAMQEKNPAYRDLILRGLLDEAMKDVPMGVADYMLASVRAIYLTSIGGALLDFGSTQANINAYLTTQLGIAGLDRTMLQYLRPTSDPAQMQQRLTLLGEQLVAQVNERERMAAFPNKAMAKALREGVRKGVADALAIAAGGITSTQLLEGDFQPGVRANFGMRDDGSYNPFFRGLNTGLNYSVSPYSNYMFRMRGIPDAFNSALAEKLMLAEIAALDHMNGRDGRSIEEIMDDPTPEQQEEATRKMLVLLWKNSNKVTDTIQSLVAGIENEVGREVTKLFIGVFISMFPKVQQNMWWHSFQMTGVPAIFTGLAQSKKIAATAARGVLGGAVALSESDFAEKVLGPNLQVISDLAKIPAARAYMKSLDAVLSTYSPSDQRRLIELIIKGGFGWLILFPLGAHLWRKRRIVPTIGMTNYKDITEERGLSPYGGQVVLPDDRNAFDLKKSFSPVWPITQAGALWAKMNEENEQLAERKQVGAAYLAGKTGALGALTLGMQNPYIENTAKLFDERRTFNQLYKSATSALIPRSPLIGQVAQTLDPYKRETRTAVGAKDDQMYEGTLNNIRAGMPIAREKLPIKIDVFGDEVEAPHIFANNFFGRALANLMNPFGFTKLKETNAPREEYLRLGTSPQKSKPRDNEDQQETGAQYLERLKREGQAVKQLQTAVLANPMMKDLVKQDREVRNEVMKTAVQVARRMANGKSVLTPSQAEFNVVLAGIKESVMKDLKADPRYKAATPENRKLAEQVAADELGQYRFQDGEGNRIPVPKLDPNHPEYYERYINGLNDKAQKAKVPVAYTPSQLLAMPEDEQAKAFYRLLNAANEVDAKTNAETLRRLGFGQAQKELARQIAAKKKADEDKAKKGK